MPLGTRSDSVNRYAMIFAEVAVNAPAGYDRTFSYSIPDSLKLSPGHSVRVPFGPQKLQGVMVRINANPRTQDHPSPRFTRSQYPQYHVNSNKRDHANKGIVQPLSFPNPYRERA